MAKNSGDYSLDRGLPMNPDAERAILGAILLDNSTYWQASELIKPDDFGLDSHRRIFSRMVELAEESRGIDFVTLGEQLAQHKEVESVGGVVYVTSLTDGLPRVKNIEQYVQIVKDKAILRQLIHASSLAVQSAYEQEKPASEIIADAEEAVMRIAEQRISNGLADIETIVKEDFGSLEQLFQRGRRITGIETYFEDLDNMTSGFHEGELIIVAARPGVGKSAWAINVAENCSLKDDKTVLIFSLEMKRGALLQRMICSRARVDSHRFRTGFIGREEYSRLNTALSDLLSSKIFIEDHSALTLSEFRAKCRKFKQRHGKLDLVIVDYLQLMSGGKQFKSRTEEISTIARGLKNLSMPKELDCPIIALAQLNRLVEARNDKRPILSDLRESGEIENAADLVGFLYRPEMYFPDNPEYAGMAEFILSKQRSGATGNIPLTYLKQCTRFENRASE